MFCTVAQYTGLTGFCTRALQEHLLRRITEGIQDCALLTTKYCLISPCLFIPHIRKLTGALKSVTFLPQKLRNQLQTNLFCLVIHSISALYDAAMLFQLMKT